MKSHRGAIFRPSALTSWQGLGQLELNFPELQEEHDAARFVNREAKVVVVFGNSPCNRFAGVPLEEERSLLDEYKAVKRNQSGRQISSSALFTRCGIRKQLLDHLYVCLLRLTEVRIGEKAEFGIVSFISNSSFLSGRSHPIMRESLLHSFPSTWIDNLAATGTGPARSSRPDCRVKARRIRAFFPRNMGPAAFRSGLASRPISSASRSWRRPARIAAVHYLVRSGHVGMIQKRAAVR